MNTKEFVQNTVSRSLDKYLELHPDIPDGGTTGQVMMKKSDTDGDIEWKSLIGSGWGVAKTGSVVTQRIDVPVIVDISELNIANTNDYNVFATYDMDVFDGAKSISVKKVSGTQFQITGYQGVAIYYVVIAKGYGAADMGIHFEVGAEKWYGTYTENGVTYQVYSKIVYIPALPAEAGITNVPHGVTGIKQILAVQGFCSNSMIMNAPRQNVQDNISIYQVQKSGNIAIEVGKDRSSVSAYVTIIYAKNNS